MLRSPHVLRQDAALRCLEVLLHRTPSHWRHLMDARAVNPLVCLLRSDRRRPKSATSSVDSGWTSARSNLCCAFKFLPFRFIIRTSRLLFLQRAGTPALCAILDRCELFGSFFRLGCRSRRRNVASDSLPRLLGHLSDVRAGPREEGSRRGRSNSKSGISAWFWSYTVNRYDPILDFYTFRKIWSCWFVEMMLKFTIVFEYVCETLMKSAKQHFYFWSRGCIFFGFPSWCRLKTLLLLLGLLLPRNRTSAGCKQLHCWSIPSL